MNARGVFSRVEADLRATLDDAQAKLFARSRPVALDVVVRSADYPMSLPSLVGGASLAPGRIELTLDFSQNATWDCLRGEILKALYHEYHHAVRWDGPGYGYTLGEALVSEGLAQVFVHEMIQCPPEPWEIMPLGVELMQISQRAQTVFDDESYSHPDWFFGVGDLPNWTGYALGNALAAKHLQLNPGRTALDMADEPAAAFRDTLLAFAHRR